jgi:cytochrome c oxidase subunit 2
MKSLPSVSGPSRGAFPLPAEKTDRTRAGRRGFRLAPPALALLPLLAACGEDHLKKYPQTAFAPTTEYGRIADGLFMLTLVLGVAVGIIVFALMAYIIWRYRYRPGTPEPQQIHGNTRLELMWTFIPALILAVIAVPTVRAIFATQPEPGADAITIEVVGKQWWWEFRYPVAGTRDTIVTANEIHVPVGRQVNLLLKSDNVLHSFWVPQMGGKRDLVPNRVNRLVFTPLEPGVYLGQCAEFCGDSHALMRMRLVAQTPEEFATWLDNERASAAQPAPADSAVAIGKQLFGQVGCTACHVVAQQGQKNVNPPPLIGPNLTHVGRRRTIAGGILENNAENLNTWINHPQDVKPGAKMIKGAWTPEQVKYIAAYLQTLQ